MLALAAAVGGCATLQRTAVNRVGDALAAGGATYAQDDDPELIRAAAPFSLKLIESLLAEAPEHRGLLLAAARGFTQYAYAFVQEDADEQEASDVGRATVTRHRARQLYLRARDYGLHGLATTHRRFRAELERDPGRAVQSCTRADVPLLYWTAAAWASAIAVRKDRPDLIAELPQAEALIERALQLDAAYDRGAIHVFLITYEMARPGARDPAARARAHFAAATELGRGELAAPYVALAEAVSLPAQNRAEFLQLLQSAVAVDARRAPEYRLANLVVQRRAQWLLGRVDELFLPEPAPDGSATTAASPAATHALSP